MGRSERTIGGYQQKLKWCLDKEGGPQTLDRLTPFERHGGAAQNIRFDAKYWLVQSGGRYVITDVAITTLPGQTG
ncbi:MAG: hypothetical protein ABI838_06590 [Chloroflexota bacterium]